MKIIEKMKSLASRDNVRDVPERIDALDSHDPWPIRWRYHHIYRYRLAKKYCQKKWVLDAGCGYGYGSFMLSRVSKKVVGIDISEDTIQMAKKRYSSPNLEFMEMDVEKMSFDSKFDVIISFENIEHIENPGIFLDKARFHLDPRGVFIISTPNKKYTGSNPYHSKEYNREQFEQFLKQYFQVLKIEGQYLKSRFLYPIYFLESYIPWLTWLPCFLGKLSSRKSTVMIAVCRNPL
jgi:2-polyprenyl-3-methyl-5-hydroxy-6-metoxy-1,4-benzoquinol methylase